MNSKLLVRINDLNEINEYKKVGITNFLFPLDGFSIGYNTFKIDELKMQDNVFLLINRVLDKKTLDDFINLKDELGFVKGIFFEDIAIYQVLKNINIDLYYNQAHNALSTNSINFWLKNVKSVVLSNELTKDEINEILSNANNPLVLPIFGKNMAMHSRRYLLSNYNIFNNSKITYEAILKTGNIEFKAKESEYGTVFFFNKYFNLINEISSFNNTNTKILYYYIDPNELEANEMIEIINGKEIDNDNRFFEKKTIYKIGDIND